MNLWYREEIVDLKKKLKAHEKTIDGYDREQEKLMLKLKAVEGERDRLVSRIRERACMHNNLVDKLHALEEIARELIPSHTIACKQYGPLRQCGACMIIKKIDELMGKDNVT